MQWNQVFNDSSIDVTGKKMKDGSEENKRARRALGRSPEEKVKGQGEAIYRGPLMWGLLDDAIYQIWKL